MQDLDRDASEELTIGEYRRSSLGGLQKAMRGLFALTMDVLVPENPNGIGIIKVVSGGWKSRYDRVTDGFSSPYTDHGYTVFAVFHGSQPRYKVRDIMGFMHRAVPFIRTNADRLNGDPDRIGVTGNSAGGHLSLILAITGGPGDPEADDPIDRASSAVRAVGVFYPPTDYLNSAEPGDDAVGIGKQARWQPAFGDESKTAEGRQILGRAMSSIYHISEQTPPISTIHGDADPTAPLFQSQSFRKIAESKGVAIELVIEKRANHGWPNKEAELVRSHRRRRDAVREQVQLLLLDPVLHLPPRAVQLLVQGPVPIRPRSRLVISKRWLSPRTPPGSHSALPATRRLRLQLASVR